MYVQRNRQTRSCKLCCSEKAISITYCECVFVALGIQHAAHTPYCHLWPAQLYNFFFFTLSHKGHNFRKIKKVIERKIVFLFSL